MKEHYNYQETLEIIENLMQNSGVRNFCTIVCQGQCCKYCEPKDRCHNNENNQRRLCCSNYLCANIFCRLHNDEVADRLCDLEQALEGQYKSILQEPSSDNTMFFTPTPPAVISQFQIKKEILDKAVDQLVLQTLQKIMTERCQDIAKCLFCHSTMPESEIPRRIDLFKQSLTTQT